MSDIDTAAELARAEAPSISSCCFHVGTPDCQCVPTAYVPAAQLRALLDAADERDRLREIGERWARSDHRTMIHCGHEVLRLLDADREATP